MYTVDHLLRNLILEIWKSEKRVSNDTNSMDLRELKETLRELLKEKKYLIVLDDAWNPRAFGDLNNAFVDSKKGSRIFITSRDAKVAFLAPESHRLELRPLGESESWRLFCQKAFALQRKHDCPLELEKWAREIAVKCQGLPLAIVSIGSMLSLREKSVAEWKRVHNQLSWEFEHNPSFDNLRNILNLSFNYLPRNLKNCFLYCCMFPDDHLLTRKKLIRLWIAEGFIEERGTSTLEEVAEGYLVELVRRSMLQLVETNEFGTVLKRCRMHDTLRELAITLCTKENFGLLYENNKIVNVDTITRRLSVIKSSNEIRYDANLLQLRTFLSFDSNLSSSLLSSILLNSRYLTILNLEGLAIETLPDTVGDLLNLHYLGLRDTKVKFIPISIKKLCNLQTLDLYQSKIETLPNCIVELSKLRHLFGAVVLDKTSVSFRHHAGIHVPDGLFHLKDLQTLKALEADAEVVKKLGNLTQLRSFIIWNMKESYSTDLCISISKIHFLSSLYITASSENEFINLGGLNSPPPQLQKLSLRGRLKEKMFESALFQVSGKNLQTLVLGWSRLQADPLPSLSHLSNLTILDLKRAYDGQRLVFQSGWFPKLKFLLLQKLPSLVEVELEEGTLERVEQIFIKDMEQLIVIPKGIEHLTSLKELHCVDLSANFGGLLKGYNKLWHFDCYFKPLRSD
ncbi:hypothetical protein LUZ60_005221 [Juncus effusus]|nr:hypothetical protein LUZ60_005221 [Juncus effusus]